MGTKGGQLHSAQLVSGWLMAKIQQTKMLAMCQKFGDLFLFGLVWQYSSVQM